MSRPFLPRSWCLMLLAATAAMAATAAPAAARQERGDLLAHWRAQGLEPVRTRGLDSLYVRPGAPGPGGGALQVAPVLVELRPNWHRASRELGRTRLRPAEVQRMKDEVAAIVEDELRSELAHVRAIGDATAPVLEARVVDLYFNAPDLHTVSATRTYTRSFGDMVLVAELRDRRGGRLLLGSWDHRPAREHGPLRETTRVDNAIEVRAAAQAWARKLRLEFERLHAGR